MELISQVHCFAGEQRRYRHQSEVLDCEMHFSVYIPPSARSGPVPVILFLSGLTCTDENFSTKAGAQRYAAERGVALVAPDTSPRGDHVPDAPDDAWDLGKGAGFYVNATEDPWKQHYQMESYIMEELPSVLAAVQGRLDLSRVSVMGHSMGGHGALVLALRYPGRFMSVSAFAPICAPTQCDWGRKAFSAYLGNDESAWEQYDACALLAGAKERLPLLIDQGEGDVFLADQLHPEKLSAACREAGHPLNLRMHPGYDHGYYFVSTFIGDHIDHHAATLGGANPLA